MMPEMISGRKKMTGHFPTPGTLFNALFATFLAALLGGAPLQAQSADSLGVVTGSGSLQVYKYDARSSALGNAGVADYRDLSSINMNPAALTFVRELRTLHLTLLQNWENNLMSQSFTLPAMAHGPHRVTAQLGIQHKGSGATSLIGSPTRPEPDLMMVQADLVYAWSLENILSFGIMNSVSFANNEHARFWSYHAVLGALYAPSQSVSYGISFRGLGRGITYELLDNGRTALGSRDLGEVLELGATLSFPVDTDHTWLSLSLANMKRFSQRGVWYTGGLEVKPIPELALRSGLLFHPEERIYLPRFGFGIELERFRLDYTISHKHQWDDRYHQLGLILHL